MARYKSKAEKAFEVKVEAALEARDWTTLETVYHQYGCYLELIDMNSTIQGQEVNLAARAAQDLIGVEVGTGELVFT